MEIWKDIPITDKYQASSLGSIRNKKSGKPLAQFNNSNGYRTVSIRYNDGKKTFKVHRLIAMTFIKELSSGEQVDHINRLRDDNTANNLRISTHAENNLNKVNKRGLIHKIIELHETGEISFDSYKYLMS